LLAVVGSLEQSPSILDVGGRKSHYTIGIPASITISDLPREEKLQEELNLGVTRDMIKTLYARRSNVHRVVFDDMTCSAFRDNSFDCVLAIEVLEHVEADVSFVKEVYRVLKPCGVFFMTTPNGDYVPNTNPDHKRHYKGSELKSLLERYFQEVDVEYAVRDGIFYRMGRKSLSVKRPVQTGLSMLGNIINLLQSSPGTLRNQVRGTCHLVATTRKLSEVI